MTKAEANARLELIRESIEAESVSYSELAELNDLAEYIDSGDVTLLEWAGVPEDDYDRVYFRVFPEGDVIALFPDLYFRNGLITSYMHVGQHSDADIGLITELRPATPKEYESLKTELEQRGYNLFVR